MSAITATTTGGGSTASSRTNTVSSQNGFSFVSHLQSASAALSKGITAFHGNNHFVSSLLVGFGFMVVVCPLYLGLEVVAHILDNTIIKAYTGFRKAAHQFKNAM
jgi:hypothetical protein